MFREPIVPLPVTVAVIRQLAIFLMTKLKLFILKILHFRYSYYKAPVFFLFSDLSALFASLRAFFSTDEILC